MPIGALVVLGTRPEVIKMAPVVERLRADAAFRVRVCTTGQHRDLVGPLLRFFAIAPDHELDVMGPGGLAQLTGRVIAGVERVLLADRPDVVLVHGDTTTTLGAALAAFYARVPVAHVEAGLRTHDLGAPFPEEANRALTGVLARWHFAPSDRARSNLLRSGVDPSSVFVTGNTVVDALHAVRARLEGDPDRRRELDAALPGLAALRARGSRVVLVTCHRRETQGPALEQVLAAVRRLATPGDVEVVFSVHPNPQVARAVRRALAGQPGLILAPPLPYLPFVDLMLRADLLVTDSGGIQEEAPSLGKRVLVLRETTERPEGVATGSVRLVGTATTAIVEAVRAALAGGGDWPNPAAPNPHGDGRASARIARHLRQLVAPRHGPSAQREARASRLEPAGILILPLPSLPIGRGGLGG